ncbi:MAG: diguanylate cyclase [Gammaproteobacteria bacterium]|nr:diguanylate cyclase [Gammaproteobacteria bacterium]
MLNKLTLEEAHTLLDACPLGILLIDNAGQPRGFNAAFAELVGDAVYDLANTSADLRNEGLLAPLLGQGTLVNWIMPDGDVRWLAVHTVPLDDHADGTARFYQDVTEKLRHKQERDALTNQLREQSLKDTKLTSLLSRHGVLVSLEPLVARSRRYNSPLSIVVMGLDNAEIQQRTLMKISYLLKDQTRWADLVGCTEGRNFILILQETSQDSALQLVNKLGEHLGHISDDQEDSVTACYGVTQCQKNDNVQSLLERAESALNEARNNDSGIAIAV